MWTLSQTRTKLAERLAESSTTFWSASERDGAVNEAQRFIAGVTRGVPLTLTGDVDLAVPYLTVTGKLLGEYPVGGKTNAGRSLSYVPHQIADVQYPGWRSLTGTPRWLIAAPHEDRVYVAPVSASATPVTVNVSVLPADLVNDGDELFGGETVMEKYQGALLNVAASLLLLKERYDGDAERFYQFAVQEIQSLGVNPAEIPPIPRQVPQNG